MMVPNEVVEIMSQSELTKARQYEANMQRIYDSMNTASQKAQAEVQLAKNNNNAIAKNHAVEISLVEAKAVADDEKKKRLDAISQLQELETKMQRRMLSKPGHDGMDFQMKRRNKELERAKSEMEVAEARGDSENKKMALYWQDQMHHVLNARSINQVFERYATIFEELCGHSEDGYDVPPALLEANKLKSEHREYRKRDEDRRPSNPTREATIAESDASSGTPLRSVKISIRNIEKQQRRSERIKRIGASVPRAFAPNGALTGRPTEYLRAYIPHEQTATRSDMEWSAVDIPAMMKVLKRNGDKQMLNPGQNWAWSATSEGGRHRLIELTDRSQCSLFITSSGQILFGVT